MWMGRLATLLCVSFAAAAPAMAQEAAPFVTQLRLASRNAVVDAFAWRGAEGVSVARTDLQRLSIRVPANVAGERVSLSAIPGLTYSENAGAAAIEIRCTSACFATQQLTASPTAEQRPTTARLLGGYLNYDVDAQWIDGQRFNVAGLGEASVFGRFGLFESSWLGATGGEARGARLETRWTMDMPRQRLRLRVGDSALGGVGGGFTRFAGVQLGRHFGLEPSMITYPTPLLAGEADGASTVELYVDGALRARENVQAGPFAFEGGPMVSGAGEAELIVTDILGRQQTITRRFFVSTAMLRPGLTDWSVAFGAERRDFGRRSLDYGQSFAAARYRAGITNWLTADAALESSEETGAAELGATFAHVAIGQIRLSRAQGGAGSSTSVAWFREADSWSFGVQADQWDRDFRSMGSSEELRITQSLAASVNVRVGSIGDASLTAAAIDSAEDPQARTLSLAYTPDFGPGFMSFRLTHTQRETSDLAFAMNLSLDFNGDVSSSFGYEVDGDGASYRASSQRAPDEFGRFSWRSRAIAGRQERIEFSGQRRGRYGNMQVQAVRTDVSTGLRMQHTGSVGWIDRFSFAGRPIQGSFALVDAGASGVGVLRDRLPIGDTGSDGRVLAVNLRPYDSNTIAIRPDDLPFDRTPTATEIDVAPSQGAGVVVRFDEVTRAVQETHVRYANGAVPARGAVLQRQRDGARFPVGTDGRVVLLGAAAGDVLALSTDPQCSANADEDDAANGLTLICAEAS
jgi:outer membrane usher protein